MHDHMWDMCISSKMQWCIYVIGVRRPARTDQPACSVAERREGYNSVMSCRLCGLQVEGVYRPRFRLDPNVMRVPIVPGCDPRLAYGDLAGRGVRGGSPVALAHYPLPRTLHLKLQPFYEDVCRRKSVQTWCNRLFHAACRSCQHLA